MDSSGAIYFADSAALLIRVFTPGGVVTTLAGASGVNGYGGDGPGLGGVASLAIVSNPQGLLWRAVSGNPAVASELFFVDNNRIRVISMGPPPTGTSSPSTTPSPSPSVCMPCNCAVRSPTSSRTPTPSHTPPPNCLAAQFLQYSRYTSFDVEGSVSSLTGGVVNEVACSRMCSCGANSSACRAYAWAPSLGGQCKLFSTVAQLVVSSPVVTGLVLLASNDPSDLLSTASSVGVAYDACVVWGAALQPHPPFVLRTYAPGLFFALLAVTVLCVLVSAVAAILLYRALPSRRKDGYDTASMAETAALVAASVALSHQVHPNPARQLCAPRASAVSIDSSGLRSASPSSSVGADSAVAASSNNNRGVIGRSTIVGARVLASRSGAHANPIGSGRYSRYTSIPRPLTTPVSLNSVEDESVTSEDN